MNNHEVNRPFHVMTCEICDKINSKLINVEGEVRLKAGNKNRQRTTSAETAAVRPDIINVVKKKILLLII